MGPVVFGLRWGSGGRGAGQVFRRVLAFLAALVVMIALVVVPVAVQVIHPAAAKASSGNVLILATSVNGGSASAEAAEVTALGYTPVIESASSWDALSESGFEAYSAIIIGDPSTSSTCSTTVPADALSTASTWGGAVTAAQGRVAVLGTAPSLAGSPGTALMKAAIGYALSGSGTGLYVSLNCEYASASAGTSVPLLADVYGGGFQATGQSSSCANSGTVNTWVADSTSAFTGFASSSLASWASPACSVEETLNAWPSEFSVLGYDSGASPAVFTASDGATGQPYVLLGSSAADSSAALSEAAGGEVQNGAASGTSNAADPGLAASQKLVADPVNPETGALTESATDVTVPSYGPSLGFTRTYSSALAQAETRSGSPGSLGYGWTGNYGTSVSSGTAVPGYSYTISGRDTWDGNGWVPARQPLWSPGAVAVYNGDTYIADTEENRIEEIAGATGTEWGITMTAGHMYTVAGIQYGQSGDSANGTAAASTALKTPQGVAVNSTGLYIADTGNCRVAEIPWSSGTQWGISMTAGDLYTIAGVAGTCGTGSDKVTATSSELMSPAGIFLGSGTSAGSLYIADAGNNRIQELAGAAGTQWGQSMTADDIYTVAGSSAGTSGDTAAGSAATSTLLDDPMGVAVGSSGNLFIADTDNCRALVVPYYTGTQWGQSMTINDAYVLAGRNASNCGVGNDAKAGTASDLDYPQEVWAGNGNLYIADTGNNRIQEVAGSTHTEFGQSMTGTYIYTVSGSSAGTAGYSGDGSAATSALMDYPEGVWIDTSTGDLYAPDSYNNRIRDVDASTYDIATIAGTGGNRYTEIDGPATATGLSGPEDTATDTAGDVFIADTGNNRIVEIAASARTQFGIAMTAGYAYDVAGSAIGTAGSSGDGGAATSALLNGASGIIVDASGNLYIADWGNNRVQEVSASTGHISTIAGSSAGTAGHTGDGAAATSALLDEPSQLGLDSSGDLYIADSGNNRVQEIAAATGTQHGISMTKGDIYTIAGNASGTAGYSGIGGTATSADLEGMSGLAASGAGDVYLTDAFDCTALEVPASSGTYRDITMTANHIYLVAGDGTCGHTGNSGLATSAELNYPMGVAVDSSSDLYVGDTDDSRVQEIPAANGTQWTQAMTAGHVYTIAGSATGSAGYSGDGGKASSARLYYPVTVTVDSDGNVFIPDEDNNVSREMVAAASSPFGVWPPGTSYTAATVTEPDGSQATYYPESSGSCTSPYVVRGSYCALPQYTGTLTYSSAAGTWSFVPSAGTTYVYNSSGALASEADAAGDTLSVTYGSPSAGSGYCPSTAASCDTVTAADGRALVIALNSAGLITSVTDPLDRTWTYAYNSSDDLTSVTDPMSRVTSYTYGGTGTLASDLLKITKPAGGVTTNTYDTLGRVATQTDPMGYETTFDYSSFSPATGTGVVWVGDPDGYRTAYDYIQGALAAQSDWNSTSLGSETDYGADTTSGTLLDSWSTDGNPAEKSSYTYNSAGDVTATTSPASTTTTSEYTALGGTSCDGDAEASAACSSSETGPAAVSPGGAITVPASAPPAGVTYALYDTDGNELYTDTGVYQPGSSTASYQRVTYTLYKGNTVTLNGTAISCTYTPPAQDLPCAKVNADGIVTQLEYNSYGDLILSAAPYGAGTSTATTTYTYDADGEQLTEVAPDGNVTGATTGNYTTVTAYNSDGEKTSVSQGDGSGATVTARTTTYGYDSDGNQTSVKDARGYTTTTAYNLDDQATLVTNPDSGATLTCYDGDGHTVQTVPAAGVAASSLTASSCPTSYPADYGDRLASDATTYTYDAAGNKTAETSPAPAGHTGDETTSYTYDAAGNLTETDAPPASNTTGASDNITVDTYTSDGELSTATTGYGTSTASTIAYCYDADGNKTTVIPGDGNASAATSCSGTSAYATTYTYDSAGEMVTQTTPVTSANASGGTTTYTYDDAGNELTVTDPKGITTTYTYDAAGKKATITYSGSSAHEVTYTYDADGNKTQMTDATGTSTYTYNPFDELTSTTNGNGSTVSYGYDTDGDITGITYPLPSAETWSSTSTISYGYDNADQMTSVTDFNGHKTTLTRNADGNVTAEALGATGDTVTTAYDSTGAIASITLANSSGTTLQSFTYGDAPGGNILSETSSPATAGTSKTYSYDPQSQLAAETTTSGTTSYSFDDSGNLTGLPSGATGTYDDAGELTSSTNSSGTVTDYTYNADGQRTAATKSGTTVASATWNGAGELTSYDDSSGDMTTATYDGNGLRASSATTSGGTQDYTWNTLTEVPQLLTDSTNAYIYTTGAAPAEQVNLTSGTITYLTTDSLGSVRGTVSSSGSLTGSATYDAWGNPLTVGGLTATTPYGYAGSYTDATGLLYLINRYYDPATGQFDSIDPMLLQTQQPYAYVDGNPVSKTDPAGRQYRCLDWTCGYEFGRWTTWDLEWDAWVVGMGIESASAAGICYYTKWIANYICGWVVSVLYYFAFSWYGTPEWTGKCLYLGIGWGRRGFMTNNGCHW